MDLMGTADALGVRVETGILPEGWWGAWNPRIRTIRLRVGLGVDQHRSTLAHELGHVVHNHWGTSPEQEAEAQRWAARALIDPVRICAAARAVNWLGILARELQVMPSDVAAFYASLSDKEIVDARALLTMEPRGY